MSARKAGIAVRFWLMFGWIALLFFDFYYSGRYNFYLFDGSIAIIWLGSCIWGVKVLKGKEKIGSLAGFVAFVLYTLFFALAFSAVGP